MTPNLNICAPNFHHALMRIDQKTIERFQELVRPCCSVNALGISVKLTVILRLNQLLRHQFTPSLHHIIFDAD